MGKFYMNKKILEYADKRDYAVAVMVVAKAGAEFVLGHYGFRMASEDFVTDEISLDRVRRVINRMTDDGILVKFTRGNKHKKGLYMMEQPTTADILNEYWYIDWMELPLYESLKGVQK